MRARVLPEVQQNNYIKLDIFHDVRARERLLKVKVSHDVTRARKDDRMTKQGIHEWLTAQLADGPLPTFIIMDRATRAGYKRKHVRIARVELGIKTRKSGGVGWVWTLPDPAAAAAKREQLEEIRRRFGRCP